MPALVAVHHELHLVRLVSMENRHTDRCPANSIVPGT
jgi:hypothetical protein